MQTGLKPRKDFGTVGELARFVINLDPNFKADLLRIFPKRFLERRITKDNCQKFTHIVDLVRLNLECALVRRFGNDNFSRSAISWVEINRIARIISELKEQDPEFPVVREVQHQIRFLMKLALGISQCSHESCI